MRTVKWLVPFIVVLSMILSACGGAAPTTVATEEPKAEPKVATLIYTEEPDNMNPHYTNMWFSTILHPLWLLETWQFDDKNEVYPVLIKEMPSADNGGISADGKVLTLHLRDDITWSDGEPVTSADFKFTFDMAMEPKNAVATTFPYDSVASVETPDAKTVVVNFAEPFAPWLLLFKGILPKHVLQPVFDKDGTIDNAEWNKNPTVALGPYVLKEWQSGSFLHFVRNEKYYGTKPVLDEIFIRIVPDDASQVAALKAGDGDIGIFIAYPDIPALEAAGSQIVSVASGYSEGWYISLNEKSHPALKDVRVRQALAYATDRFKITKDLLLGKTEPGATLWDKTPYVDPSLKPYPYDVEKAKALLDEAGWKDSNGDGTRDKDGVELVLRHGTTTREVRQNTQAIVQQMLADVGIKLEILNYDSDIFFASYDQKGPTYTGELDIFEWSDALNFPDPDSSYFRCDQIPTDESPQGTNAQFLCDPELEALFQQQKSQVDVDERIATFHKISKLMYDQVYWLSFWLDPDIWAVGARMVNVKLSGITPFYNIGEWDLK